MIRINGKQYAFKDFTHMTVFEYIAQQGLNSDYLVVEINQQIVPKRLYKEQKFHSGDSVEIVCFVGGG